MIDRRPAPAAAPPRAAAAARRCHAPTPPPLPRAARQNSFCPYSTGLGASQQKPAYVRRIGQRPAIGRPRDIQFSLIRRLTVKFN
jgi:hypothetical protein